MFQNKLVVVGGADERKENQGTSEYYDDSSNKWSLLVAQLNHKRSGHAVVTHDGCLYAIGGSRNDEAYTSSVHRISSLTATAWEEVKSMQTPRRWLAAVTCKGEIYAIGGKSGENKDTTLKSVEKYDSVTDQWKFVSEMNIERSSHAAAVLNGKIYVVGGINANLKAVKEAECYDPDTDNWKIVKNVEYSVWKHSLVAI